MAAPGVGGSQGGTEDEHEVVRVRVKKCEGLLPPEFRSFAIDPQITSFDVLQHILVRAFDLGGKKSFGISYMGRDRQGQDTWFPLLSDGDLGVAFAGASCPHLQLRVDIRTAEDSPLLEDWDIISPKDVVGSEPLPGERRSLAAAALPLTQAILSQVGRTLWRVQQALSWTGGEETPAPAPPLNEAEFHALLSPDGCLARPEDLRLRVYHGGVEPSLRKVVWRHLLNVYPVGLTAPQRLAYVRHKAREYEVLKQAAPGRAPGPEDAAFVRAAVAKDVARTDRAQPYYAGPDDGPRLRALEDLLVTYALAHPRVSYCQGMSDLASPLLAVLDDEAQAYVCFCGLMKRLEGNFLPDGRALGLKFAHLRLLLRHLDPTFHAYLAARGADDLFFCYRWLLLELKREFAFEDALRVLEVLWSSLPPDPPEKEVELEGPPLEGGRGLGVRGRHMLRPVGGGGEEEEEGKGVGGGRGFGGCYRQPGGGREGGRGVKGHPGRVAGPLSCFGDHYAQPAGPVGGEGGDEGIREGPVGLVMGEQGGGGSHVPGEEVVRVGLGYYSARQGGDEGVMPIPRSVSAPSLGQVDMRTPTPELQGVAVAPLPASGSPVLSLSELLASFPVLGTPKLTRPNPPALSSPSGQLPGRGAGPFSASGTPVLSLVDSPPPFPTSGAPMLSQSNPLVSSQPSGEPQGGSPTPFPALGTSMLDPVAPFPISGTPVLTRLNPPGLSPTIKEPWDRSPALVTHPDFLLPPPASSQPLKKPWEESLASSPPPTTPPQPSTQGSSPALVTPLHCLLTTLDPSQPPREICGGSLSPSPPLTDPPHSLVPSPPTREFQGGSTVSPLVAVTPSSCLPNSMAANRPLLCSAPPPALAPPLPPPQELGRGNPFLLFVCVAMLLEQRERLLRRDLDYDDVAVHFDRLVRRHSLTRVLPRARALFADYLRSEVWDSEEVDEAAAESPPPS